MVGRSCRTRGPSGGLTAAAARGAAHRSMVARTHVNDALGSFLLRANEVIDQVPMSACGHQTDMPKYLGDVRCWVNSGKHLLALSFSGFDPNRTFVPAGERSTTSSRRCGQITCAQRVG